MDSISIPFYYLQQRFGQKFKNRSQLENWQKKHLERLLNEAPKRFRFYNTYIGRSFEQLPILNKQIFMKYFRDLNAFDISVDDALPVAFGAEQSRNFIPRLKGLAVGLSPGTSGHRGLFFASQVERQQWAAQILAKTQPKPIWKSCKIAFCFRDSGNLYSKLASGQRYHFTFFDIQRSLDEILVNLNRFQPDLLVAPAYVLRLLADARRQGQLNLNPRKIASIGEVLGEKDRLWIESRFNLPVHQLYLAAEGFLGSTCHLGTLHLNEDIIHFELEYLDRNQERFIPIITDLFRTSQAIIRYRLNDILIKSPTPCPCGSVMTAISKIEGRCEDIFYLPNRSSSGLSPIFPDLIRHRLETASDKMSEFQVVQSSPSRIELYFESKHGSAIQEPVAQALESLWNEQNVEDPELTFHPGVRHDLTQKYRRVFRSFEVEDEVKGALVKGVEIG